MRTPEELIGRTIAGKFAILEHIGSGAMGEVYRARHILLESVVALKVLRHEFNADPSFKERFLREARAASRLTHQNTVRVIDFGFEKEGLTYIAMEYVEGSDLLQTLSVDWPLSDTRIADILSQVLAALSAAHKAGIVHRDLKPENILIQSVVDDDGVLADRVKVCDFGIAKVSEQSPHRRGERALTSSGTLIGTPEYMSPEQAEGREVDARSDIYSVGIVLYQMLTRELPFEGENAINIVIQQVSHDPPRPSSLRPEVNPRLEEICLRALQKHPLHRYQSAREMRADLRAAFGWMTAAPPSVAEVSQMVAAAAFQSDDPVVYDEDSVEVKPEDSATWRPPRRQVESEGLKMLDTMVGERVERAPRVSSVPPPSGFSFTDPPAEEVEKPKRGRLLAVGSSVVLAGMIVGSLFGWRARTSLPTTTTVVQANAPSVDEIAEPVPSIDQESVRESTDTPAVTLPTPTVVAPSLQRSSATAPLKARTPRAHPRPTPKADSKADGGAPKSPQRLATPKAPPEPAPAAPSRPIWPQIDEAPVKPPPLPAPSVTPPSPSNAPTF